MSVNKYQDHLLVLPEDDAIREIAVGFLLEPSLQSGRVDILHPAGGWKRVLDVFLVEYVRSMTRYQNRHVVLVIDFDGEASKRLPDLRAQIPDDCADRVFVIGIASESEDLRRAFKVSFEDMGKVLAADCLNETLHAWGHDLLKDNAIELQRLRESKFFQFLFSQE
jgi:hypothetical protein